MGNFGRGVALVAGTFLAVGVAVYVSTARSDQGYPVYVSTSPQPIADAGCLGERVWISDTVPAVVWCCSPVSDAGNAQRQWKECTAGGGSISGTAPISVSGSNVSLAACPSGQGYIYGATWGCTPLVESVGVGPTGFLALGGTATNPTVDLGYACTRGQTMEYQWFGWGCLNNQGGPIASVGPIVVYDAGVDTEFGPYAVGQGVALARCPVNNVWVNSPDAGGGFLCEDPVTISTKATCPVGIPKVTGEGAAAVWACSYDNSVVVNVGTGLAEWSSGPTTGITTYTVDLNPCAVTGMTQKYNADAGTWYCEQPDVVGTACSSTQALTSLDGGRPSCMAVLTAIPGATPTTLGGVYGNGVSTTCASSGLMTGWATGGQMTCATNAPTATGLSGVATIGMGGTNNGSLAVVAGNVYYGDGSKVVGATGTYGQALTWAAGAPGSVPFARNVSVTSDIPLPSSGAVTALTGLSWTVPSSTRCSWTCNIIVNQTGANNGLRLEMADTSVTSTSYSIEEFTTSATAPVAQLFTSMASLTTQVTSSAATYTAMQWLITGTVLQNSNTTLSVSAASSNAVDAGAGNGLTVRAGSTCTYQY